MVAAGVSNHSPPSFLLAKRSDFVVGPAKFESADWLLILKLQVKLAVILGSGALRKIRFDEMSADGYAAKASLGFTDVVKSDDLARLLLVV
jgi:hypothetical protein